jgi:hypothetical protein
MKPSKKWLMIAVATLALSGAFVAGAQVKDLHASHAHPAGGTQLTLNAGKKWQTDAPLRQGMSNVRDLVQAAVPGVHGNYTPDDYLKLATSIEKELGTIITTCKLPPEVDAQAHLLLAELYAGTATMKQEGPRQSGVVKVLGALESYPQFFEHPDWKPVRH